MTIFVNKVTIFVKISTICKRLQKQAPSKRIYINGKLLYLDKKFGIPIATPIY